VVVRGDYGGSANSNRRKGHIPGHAGKIAIGRIVLAYLSEDIAAIALNDLGTPRHTLHSLCPTSP
jgi:hypothetical protein